MMDCIYRRVRVVCDIIAACGGSVREVPRDRRDIAIPRLSAADRSNGAWRWYASIGDVGCYNTPRAAMRWDIWHIEYGDNEATWTIEEHTGNLYRLPGVKYVIKRGFAKPRMFGIDGKEIKL